MRQKLTTTKKNKANNIEINGLRLIKEITLRDREREECHQKRIKDLKKWVKVRLQNWDEHVQRIEAICLRYTRTISRTLRDPKEDRLNDGEKTGKQ